MKTEVVKVSVGGIVRDRSTQQVLKNVLVSIIGHDQLSTKTNDEGKFSIVGVP
ncbi:MAG: hypothetical protein QGI86_24710 [Candidatus Poribacteria bacterium]|jgi:hypothetical protein|nr:hypothetical protein [Candidatus Poribacteria bacterium]MDP6748996.1 hypothetical protein [Candidatus Poribacteria bacterium]MDP6997666.1 hypothetical protein [Candidatus Poribacteria bacterium]MDP7279021.1 hypothetical protein [Candidatus Poribacteria bacterium]